MKTIPAEAELHSQLRSNVSYGNMVFYWVESSLKTLGLAALRCQPCYHKRGILTPAIFVLLQTTLSCPAQCTMAHVVI